MLTPPARPRPVKAALLAVIGIMVTVFALVNVASSQAREKVLYAFCSAPNCADGATPQGDLVFDKQGNIYGTTYGGGACGPGSGTVHRVPLVSRFRNVGFHEIVRVEMKNSSTSSIMT
ncbi:MAG TPA: hypothetical protein VK763_20800 [Terriglobales bacterium]|jgi:hypothetical protein|nr:hypothetical protein [Terriglobales bacterium]